MTLEVQSARVMDFPGVDLEELALAGDDNAWSLEDWAWDAKTLTAVPVAGSSPAAKRPCFGLHQGAATSSISELLGVDAAGSCCNAGNETRMRDSGAETPPESVKDGLSEAGEIGKAAPVCQVEDCGRELGGLSTYHQRCRICEVHIKEPYFLRAGRLQRFCQQCGRCHELSAFQGTKRSCREQLAKHNARRRRRTDKKAASEEPGQTLVPQSTACQCEPGLSGALTSLGPFLKQQPGEATQAAMNTQAPEPPQVPSTLEYMLPGEHYTPASFAMASLLAPPKEAGAQSQASESPGMPMVHQGMQQPLSLGMPGHPTMAVGIPVPSAAPSHPSMQPAPPSSFNMALAMMAPPKAESAPAYRSDNLVLRLSVKLFNCTPAELPDDLKQQLTGWLKSTPAGAEGYIRPGCVHLTVQAHIPGSGADQISMEGVEGFARHLLRQQQPVWRQHVVLADVNGRLILLKGGQLLSSWDLGHPAGGPETLRGAALPLPQLRLVSPAAVFLGASGREVAVIGQGIACGGCRVSCRAGGGYHDVECQVFDTCCQSGEGHSVQAEQQSITVRLPPSIPEGVAWLEVQKGCLLSQPLPLLICPTAELAAELNQLKDSRDLLADIHLVLTAAASCSLALNTVTRLVEFACQHDLPHLLRFLIATAAFSSLAEPAPGEASLLHLCIQHRSLAALSVLLSTMHTQVHHPGPGGVTPLHLAALQQDGGTTARLVISHCDAKAWRASLTWDGLSPSDFCRRLGLLALDESMAGLAAGTPTGLLSVAAAGPSAMDVAREEDGAITGQIVLEMGPPAREEVEPEVQLLLGGGVSRLAAESCVLWPGPLAPVVPAGLASKWSNVALLGVAACLCTCVVLLRDWM